MATPPKRAPRQMRVTAKSWITPNMIRITLAAEWIKALESGIEGAHFKLFLPRADQCEAAFIEQLESGPRPEVRTYTIRHLRVEAGEMDVDFVDHGDAGPASAWARRCDVGDLVGFAGPGPVKLKSFFADYYVLAADMSALPVAAATLEAMPRDARGIAFFEILAREDLQEINAPEGVEVHWFVDPTPHEISTEIPDRIRSLGALPEKVQTCIAGESHLAKALRQEIVVSRGVSKRDAYISAYWKIGLGEDAHQQVKRAEAEG